MKREEAVEIIKKWLMEGIYGLTKDRLGYIEGWFRKKDVEAFQMAIKALERESVLDKVREEVEQITDTIGVSYNPYVNRINVLQIIDKYRTGSKETNNK